MFRYFRIAIASCLLAGFSTAAPQEVPREVQTLSKALLAGKPLSTEQRKLLAVMSVHHFKEIKQSLIEVKLGGGEKESAQAKWSLDMLKADEKARAHSVLCGATVGWYLFFDQGSITSVPLIVSVEEGSEAARAGLLPGDVIDRCAGVALKSEASRNKFAQFMHQWPRTEPLELNVRRSGRDRVEDGALKKIKKTLVLFAKK